MDQDDRAFLKRLLATFKGEAAEHVRTVSACLIELEQTDDEQRRRRLIEDAFRATHSLKGAARAVDRTEIEAVCRCTEAVFAALKRTEIPLTGDLLDLLHAAVGVLERLIMRVDGEPAAADRSAALDMQSRLDEVARGRPSKAPPGLPARVASAMAPAPPDDATESAAPSPQDSAAAAGTWSSGDSATMTVAPSPPDSPTTTVAPPAAGGERTPQLDDTVRVQASRLDGVLHTAQALLGSKLAAQQRVHDVREAHAAFVLQRRQRARLAPDIRHVQKALADVTGESRSLAGARRELRRLLDYLGAEEVFLRALESRLAAIARDKEHVVRGLGSQVDGLLQQIKHLMMLPMSSLTEGLPKLVRDLSREQGKDVDFRASGVAIEIDRRILEALRDPLIHLVRNALDHGIETPQRRIAAGKPARASLRLSANAIQAGRFQLRISDDGAGIDEAKLRESARRLGLGDGADGASLLPLAFQSGVSTSPLVTDISGLGLGLAIVRENVERLGGVVTVESRPGAGTTFRLILPLSLATFRGVRVRVGADEFVFPTTGLERVLHLAREDIGTLEQREALRIDGRAVAVVRLAHVLELPRASRELPPMVTVVVTGAGGSRLAFVVDEVVGEQEVLVKGLGRQLRRVRNVAGATVLGDGRMLPVLYIPDLLKSARRAGAAQAGAGASEPRARAKSILVAEDSVTSRTLLKGILESAGYRVETAVDGADAFARLQVEAFDVLVSDVEMPRMDGFALTAKIRADERLAGLPVVLVTALGSREDREHGADVGANAYIVKTSFDQNNLLSAIRRVS